MADQRAIIARYSAEVCADRPGVSPGELHRLVSRFVSPVEVAPHVAGAAVDLTLVDAEGLEVDMGTPIDATPEQVFSVLADGWLYPSWVVGASRIRAVDDSWPSPGAELHFTCATWVYPPADDAPADTPTETVAVSGSGCSTVTTYVGYHQQGTSPAGVTVSPVALRAPAAGPLPGPGPGWDEIRHRWGGR